MTREVAMPEAPVLLLPDGSVARLSAPGVARVAEVSASWVAVELTEGHATFDVVHVPTRVFVVRAGAVSIFDLGTVFTVERSAGRVRVAVETGRVRVQAPTDTAELEAGESRWFSELSRAVVEAPAPAPVDASPPPRTQRTPPLRVAGPAGAQDAGQGRPARDAVEDLLAGADALRRAGHRTAAVPLLEQLLSGFASDERAPLAAFTLGKLQLEAGHPREAAVAFAAARTLAPDGPLVEDALGRELMAVERLGDEVRLRRLARECLDRFPEGTHAEAARQALTPLP